jgi:hypothetical protein
MEEFLVGENTVIVSMLRALLDNAPNRQQIMTAYLAIYEEETAHALATSPSESRLAGMRSTHNLLTNGIPPVQAPGRA